MERRKSSRKKRQTQLSFTPLPSSSPAASQYPDQIARRAASVRYGESPTKKQRISHHGSRPSSSSPVQSPFSSPFSKGKVQVVVQSPHKEISQLPTPQASSQVPQEELVNVSDGESPRKKAHEPNGGANSGDPVISGFTAVYNEDNVSRSASEDDITPIPRSRKSRVPPILLSSDEDSESQQAPQAITPTRSSFQNRNPKINSSSAWDRTKKPASQRDAKVSQGQISTIVDPFVIPSGGETTTSEDEVVTPIRRRKIASTATDTPTKINTPEQDSSDLDDEVADLEETELRTSRTRGRQQNSERSKRQSKLEELRQRRAGIRADSSSESESNSHESVTDPEEEPVEYAVHRADNLDEYEDDFLDDEDDGLGVDLGVAGVPLEYTYHANKKPFEHFKTEVEWMVHNKLNPAFDRRDEIYLLAHDKLDKEVEGYGSSRFRSSAWKEDFTNALKTRPELFTVNIPTMLEHKCDACNRSGHPPKHKVILTGKPYNRDTLETIEEEEDDDDDDNSSQDTSEAEEESEQKFFLGRFCCANAEMAHALRHWRYSLNQTVLQWLANDGHLTPAKILERDRLRQKKRQKEANRIVDQMVETGVMKELYRQFKENLEAARDAKPKHFSHRS